MKLYYYTGPDFLKNILQDKRIKISRYGRYGALNDPFEMFPFDTSDPDFRQSLKKNVDTLAQTMGLICLSGTPTSPTMWGHYAQSHTGVCLEIETDFDHIFPVKYVKTKLSPGINMANARSHFSPKNIQAKLSTKSTDWSYEEEMRLHIPLDYPPIIQKNGMHFMPFQTKPDNTFKLCRILVGFRNRYGIKNLQALVKDYRHPVTVVQTRPAFSQFEVVEQKDKDFWNWEATAEGEQTIGEQAVYGKISA
mgnify:CR=1 FL=1